jgi:hypothetical protein
MFCLLKDGVNGTQRMNEVSQQKNKWWKKMIALLLPLGKRWSCASSFVVFPVSWLVACMTALPPPKPPGLFFFKLGRILMIRRCPCSTDARIRTSSGAILRYARRSPVYHPNHDLRLDATARPFCTSLGRQVWSPESGSRANV